MFAFGSPWQGRFAGVGGLSPLVPRTSGCSVMVRPAALNWTVVQPLAVGTLPLGVIRVVWLQLGFLFLAVGRGATPAWGL